MASFLIGGRVFKTENSVRTWREDTRWDGRNQISVNTGSQWEHERLFKSRKGTYWLLSSSQWQGSRDSAQIVSNVDAASWLMINGHDMPAELQELADSVEE